MESLLPTERRLIPHPAYSFCFIYYKDAESVTTASENVNGTFWYGRRIVAKPQEPRDRTSEPQRRGERANRPPRVGRVHDGSPTTTLYVGNISFQSSDADLNNLFSTLDGVKDVRVAVDRATGWPRGFAHADFVSVEAATAALESLKGARILDRELKVQFAPPSLKETDRHDRMSQKSKSRGHNSQAEVEQRVEAEHEQAEEAQKEQKPEAGKQDMNWNA
ncbi:RNA recognition domain-containing protein [Colletotrichum graminicola M1.001]|uniref:RNA recognition domain-containing protein n=1 Tax=Colletotrichum graminicola (strain M1.001 / M2 / FGSC 10212) TaxID=645133 RepID=E3QDD6_COLGM|nr:RNA recognition domain-containing protein [Colletotrichum graminicola M1.001]EFQ28908.1 RNA recognition domain-containing protein [Colletotrichum graminicola M1.001]